MANDNVDTSLFLKTIRDKILKASHTSYVTELHPLQSYIGNKAMLC